MIKFMFFIGSTNGHQTRNGTPSYGIGVNRIIDHVIDHTYLNYAIFAEFFFDGKISVGFHAINSHGNRMR